jgi:hypothetical protein
MPQARPRREHRRGAVVRSRRVDETDDQRRRVENAVLDLIRRGTNTGFEAAALAVFAYQYERIPAYRRFCDARDRRPEQVECADQIPAIPADIFKHDLLPAGDPATVRVFLSSGTTKGSERRSRHVVESIDTYHASAMTHFDAMVMPDTPGPMSIVILGPSKRSHPESSLGCMLTWCAERHGNDRLLEAMDTQGAVDLEPVLDWLSDQSRQTAPVLLLGVTSAFTQLFALLRDRKLAFRLPADSRLVDTGGTKSGEHVLSAKGLLKTAWKSLHIPAYLCVNEYGMTEMLSQLYDDALRTRFTGDLVARSKVGPPWIRTTVVDPATLEPALPGQPGLLRHLDLANWASISALQTLDLGRTHGHGFELLGRAKDAETRGCSALLSEMRSTSEGND